MAAETVSAKRGSSKSSDPRASPCALESTSSAPVCGSTSASRECHRSRLVSPPPPPPPLPPPPPPPPPPLVILVRTVVVVVVVVLLLLVLVLVLVVVPAVGTTDVRPARLPS